MVLVIFHTFVAAVDINIAAIWLRVSGIRHDNVEGFTSVSANIAVVLRVLVFQGFETRSTYVAADDELEIWPWLKEPKSGILSNT
jgi:hypothetical protein